jgi:ketosteroid isomerase-like protein
MHPNEKVLRDLDEAQIRGDIEGFAASFTDDVIVHIPGRSSFAGEYKGRDQFLEVFQRFSERVPDYTFEPHAYFADDEHGVSLQRSHNVRGDERLDTNDTFVVHFRDGKVSELWFATDQPYEFDEFLG